MARIQGMVEQVETVPARAQAIADAAVSDTVIQCENVGLLLTLSGSCTVDINGVEYAATPNTDDDTVTVDPALSVAVEAGDWLVLSPAAQVKVAWVSSGEDDTGDLIVARVAAALVPKSQFRDGPKDDADPDNPRTAVIVETEPEPVVTDFANGPSFHDATTEPIVVVTDDGEAVRIDGDGLTTYTDDPVLLKAIPGNFGAIASDGTYVYVIDVPTLKIRKFALSTGAESLSGFPITGPIPGTLAADGTHLFVIDSNNDIAKYNASTGASVGSGFPIAGTFGSVFVDSTYVYASDVNNDIAKYNKSTGASVGSGFPIAGTFQYFNCSDGTNIFAIDASQDIRKYAVSNGVEDTSGFPIVGTFTTVTSLGGFLYAANAADIGISKYNASTGALVETFATDLAFLVLVAVGNVLCAKASDGAVYVYNAASNYQSVTIDSSQGSADLRNLTVGSGRFESLAAAVGTITTLTGQTAVPQLGHSDQKTLSSSASPTSTTNIDMNDLDMTVTVTGTSDVVWVEIHAEVVITTNDTVNVIELLVDGVADTNLVRTQFATANGRCKAPGKWRLTGLTAGTHTLEFRTRNTAGSTGATVQATHTSACYWTST